MKSLVVIGEILVEIMADTIGNGFSESQPLTGPFPSGAPAIFADQAARQGQPVALVSAVGDDDFGRLNTARLAASGVDTSGIRIDPDRPTGSAFVRYRADGTRDFVFNIRHSACGVFNPNAAALRRLADADHLHVMGSSLSSAELVAMNLATAQAVKARGGSVSFDPNLRKEILASAGLREPMRRILHLTDLFLPSGPELTLLTDADDERGAVAELFALGVRTIVQKRGAEGATYLEPGIRLQVPAIPVRELDATGAGDCFGATITCHWLRGTPPRDALTAAIAAGALAVTRRGPMEGNSSPDEIDAFIAAHRRTSA